MSSKMNRDGLKLKFGAENLSKKLLYKINPEKTIAFIMHNHPRRFNPRGGEKSLDLIISYFKNIGYNIVVITHNMKNNIDDVITEDGILFYTFCSESNENKSFDKRVKEVLLQHKVDLAIMYDRAAVESYKVCIKLKIPYILLVRWFRYVLPLPPGDMLTRHVDKNFVVNIEDMYSKSKAVITNNIYSENVIKRLYKCKCLHSYVPVFKKNRKVFSNSDGYITLVTPNKDLGEYEFITSLSTYLPHQKILLVNVHRDVKQLYERFNNITIRDYVENMETVFSDTKILLYPAYKNDVCGTSRIMMEAMSYAIPTLCNARSGLHEKSPCFVTENATIDEWVSAINTISNDYEKFSKEAFNYYLLYDSMSELDVFVNEVENILYE